jgi:hypothetical protein
MTPETTIAAILLVLTAIECGRLVLLLRKRSQYQHLLRVERTRAHFAQARNDLIGLVCQGKLDPNSRTFRLFYGIQTFILRRPDHYDLIGEMLWQQFVSPAGSSQPSRLAEEPGTWSDDIKGIVMRTAQGFELLMTDYSVIRRKLASFERTTGAVTWALRIVTVVRRWLEPRKPAFQNIESARDSMVRLAT